jgi:hypothetical protein
MIRILLLSFFVICLIDLFGQKKDFRAPLNVMGGIDKISVLPNGSVWLGTRAGELYYTDDFDKSWHYEFRDIPTMGSDQYFQVIGLNSNEILVVGQISRNGGYNPDAVLRSRNGGKDWETVKFSETGTTQIHAVDYNEKGEVWISGGPARFYYSRDFGKTWEERSRPYQGSSRVYSIDMVDSSTGYVCTQAGKISRTDNSGHSWSDIQTPYQQGMFEIPGKEWRYTSVQKIGVSGSKLIVRQGEHIFYSDTADIQWKSFSEKLTDFAIDRQTNKLWALNESGEVLRYDADLTVEKRTKNLLIKDAKDIEAIGNKLFAIDIRNNIYKVSETIEVRTLYTEDHPIETPHVVKKATAIKWGVTGNHIYNSAYDNSNWYRVEVVDFHIADLRLLNDNEAILWDGRSTNYYYNRDKDSLAVFVETHPIRDFLSDKIERITINAGSSGCFHNKTSSVSYALNSGGDFVPDTETLASSDGLRFDIHKTFSYATISGILEEIDRDPYQSISISDLRISDEDIEEYKKLVERTAKSMKKGSAGNTGQFDYRYFNDAIAGMDTIKPETITKVLEAPSLGWSTTQNWFTVTFTNAKGRTLHFTCHYYIQPNPWFLPWHVKFEHTSFISKSIDLSRMINEMTPDNFMFKKVFSNKDMIYKLIENIYITRKKKADRH